MRKALNSKFGHTLEFYFAEKPYYDKVSFGLTGTNLSILKDIVNQLIKNIKKIPNLYDVHSNYSLERTEIQIIVDYQKMKIFGTSSIMTGSEVKAIANGILAGKYEEDSKKYDIKIKLPKEERNILQNFNNIYVSNMNNTLVKLSDISQINKFVTPTQVYKEERLPYLFIEGTIDAEASLGEIKKQILNIFNKEKFKPENLEKWKHVTLTFSSDIKNMEEMFISLLITSIFSIVFTFIVLASLYESIITPFTIMTALPLAIIGGISALILTKQTIDMFTLIGMIMLLGIVAKNSILLIDYIYQKIKSGLNIDDAIVQACIVRLRPILMTSFTIIAGMIPTAFGLTQEGKFRQGMGIVIIGGIISSTILTLIVVPAIFEYTYIY